MSYDLAVWEGQRPTDNRSAGRVFEDLYDRFLDDDDAVHPPTERISAFVGALLNRWRDATEDVEEASPWAAGPLICGAGGPLVYLPLRWDRAEEASAYVADLADSMGLVCFDVQENGLRP
ncbi:hypothetical protein [Streptomyces murinus]|uniref:Uncharacterized protein n=1 Tax=Streptomyces murinus TaxID=33900 RepID=A0A7W3RLR4_STRMR|nr:hypothetical protein [Streptomyces murinus]MBA9054447.1 hypothetical protein [Streptomyces murinus]MBA9056327.1 hypothetical protein [Streptomyces murinus]UWW90811.1 hypothetical protein GO605_08005 [Streptomyces murinus]UWW95438.1 hypothetical protein GO605_34945 [Streptomyces murinus]